MDDNKAKYELNRHDHKHYYICIECNKMMPIDLCPIENLEKSLPKTSNFKITGHKLEIYGHCLECKA